MILICLEVFEILAVTVTFFIIFLFPHGGRASGEVVGLLSQSSAWRLSCHCCAQSLQQGRLYSPTCSCSALPQDFKIFSLEFKDSRLFLVLLCVGLKGIRSCQ